MSQYGYVIDNDLDFGKREAYQLFVNYFSNPILSKIKDENEYTLYGAKIELLLRENRYLLVSSPKDNYDIGKQFNLNDIKWNILQTRTLTEEYDCNSFSYTPSKKHPYNTRIFIDKRYDHMSTYKCKDFNLTTCMLHTDNTRFQYPDIGYLAGALETYNALFKIEI